jgi:hypothetical protein
MNWKHLSSREDKYKGNLSIYKAMVQAVLLYKAESWVLTTAIIQKLEAFHH